jgi:hypothetical protein
MKTVDSKLFEAAWRVRKQIQKCAFGAAPCGEPRAHRQEAVFIWRLRRQSWGEAPRSKKTNAGEPQAHRQVWRHRRNSP